MSALFRYVTRFIGFCVLLYSLLCLIFIFRVAYTDHNCRLTHPNVPNSWEISIHPSTTLYQAGLQSFDTKKWETPHYQQVYFPSRKSDVTISGWYTEVNPKAPVIIISHGIKPNCKAHSEPMLISALLTQSGMNVLNIDLQNYGDSTHVDSFIRLGQHEYLDILGAFDWLTTEKGFATSQVGLVGLSLGAVTSAIAFSQEPDIEAVWLDSPFIDFSTMFTFELQRYNLPSFFRYGVYFLADWLVGIRPDEFTCRDALSLADGRAIFLTQGIADSRIPVSQGQTFVELAGHSNVKFSHWFIPGTDHLDAMFLYPYTYQAKMTTFFTKYLHP